MPIKSRIRSIPDFPKPGIIFRDLSTLFQDPVGLRQSIDQLALAFQLEAIDKVAGIEARGFIVGSALAYRLGLGFVPVRKPGKLPFETYQEDYELEYGSATLELHTDALLPGERVLIADDLLATGGTALAATRLIRHTPEVHIVGAAFVCELPALKGRARLEAEGITCTSLVSFEGH